MVAIMRKKKPLKKRQISKHVPHGIPGDLAFLLWLLRSLPIFGSERRWVPARWGVGTPSAPVGCTPGRSQGLHTTEGGALREGGTKAAAPRSN